MIDAEDANAGNAMKPGIGATGALSDFVENIGEEVEHEVFMDSSVYVVPYFCPFRRMLSLPSYACSTLSAWHGGKGA